MKKINFMQFIYSGGLLLVGLLAGWIIFGGNSAADSHVEHKHETIAETWTCSMHPQIRQDEPGKCPLCAMDLVPVSSLAEEVGVDQVQMTESAIQLANIQTVKLTRGNMNQEVTVQGVIKPDERNLASVTAHFDGRVEKLYADFTGQYIRSGQRLATIYSPDLVTAQKELFEAVKFKESNPSYYESAIRKLKLWELTDQQIESIMAKGEPQFYFDVYAPRSGTILKKHISAGEHVKDGKVLFDIADLSKVWVVFDAYENQLPLLKEGDNIQLTSSAIPGLNMNTKISFIDPTVNPYTRTAAIRAELPNNNRQFKPEMFVEGIVTSKGRAVNDALLIPKTSVLWTGKRGIVYVKQSGFSQPTFQFREVELGVEAGDFYTVLNGLEEGEEVVSNGVFKVDASAQLLGKVSMMNPFGTGDSKPFVPDGTGPVPEIPKMGNIGQEFKNQLTALFGAYLPVKDALIQTDSVNSAMEALKLQTALANVNMALVQGEAHDLWMKHLTVLKVSIETIVNAKTVAHQREAFSPLSDTLYQSLVAFGVEGLGAYRQYCPMAFDFKGAFWLSDSDQVLNPYFGDVMLTCGSVEEKLD